MPKAVSTANTMKNGKMHSNKKLPRGVSLIEILIAIVVISVGITAATTIAVGSQEAIRDAGLSQRALYKVDEALEGAFASLKGDWTSLAASTVLSDGIYQKKVSVSDVSECVKEVESRADWAVPQRAQDASLITLFTSTSTIAALGGNCNTTPPSGDWDNPNSYGTGSVSPAGIQVTDIDVVWRGTERLAFLGSTHSAASSDDVWVFDVTNPPTIPAPLGSVNIGASITGGKGNVNALVVSGNYVYAALDEKDTQLAVIDISTPSSPVVVATSTLSGVDPLGSYPQAISIAYYDDRVYIGTKETLGPEFHIFDVSTPTNPVELVDPLGAPLWLNHNVHKISVNGTNAFIASSADSCELIILDISDPASLTNPCPPPPIPAGATVFDAQGDEDGTAVFVLGDRAYLGRARTSAAGEDEIYVLDVSDPAAISSEGSKDLNLSPAGAQVNDISASGPLVFLATSDSNAEFQVWLLDLPNLIAPSSCANTYNFPQMATGIDFADNFGFASVRSNDGLRVIYDDPSCTP